MTEPDFSSHTAEDEGFGLYIHWPFCLSKCPYCDFNSFAAETIDQSAWKSALLADLAGFGERTRGRKLTSIFFGGGTPSLMDPQTVAALIEAAGQYWGLADGIEITLEANPGTAERGRFRDFHTAGINRLSLGVQALNDADLRFLGRIHNSAEAFQAIDLAASIFDRFTFDLIYARPQQSQLAWEEELSHALTLAKGHISLYQLSIEEGTAFHPAAERGDIVLPDTDSAAELFLLTQDITKAAGVPAYEISNHAKPGQESRHNLTYWRGGDYIGIGPGAHGRLTAKDGVWATRQHRAPDIWLKGQRGEGENPCKYELISPSERIAELLMMGLRLSAGLDRNRFLRLAGRRLDYCLPQDRMAELVRAGMMQSTPGLVRVTDKGRLLLDWILGQILP